MKSGSAKEGMRVASPDGVGVILKVHNADNVTIRLDRGPLSVFDVEKLVDEKDKEGVAKMLKLHGVPAV